MGTRRRFWISFLAVTVPVTLLSLLVYASSIQPSGTLARVEAPTSGDAPAPPVAGESLESKLYEISVSSPGEYGIAVFDARSGESVEISAEKDFTAASLAKLPVFLTLYKEAAEGDLSLDERIWIQPNDVTYEGAGVLQTYPVGYEMSLRDCAEHLMKESDNTAWMMLERRLGGGLISTELSSLGLEPSEYYSRTTTPEDVMVMLKAISSPDHTSPELSEEMLRMMVGTSFEERLPEPLPDDVSVAHKIGTLDDTFSDAGIVFDDDLNAKDAYYIVVISSGAGEPEAREAIQKLSLATYEAFR